MRFIIITILCLLSPWSLAHGREQKLKLPDYYIGAWESTAENYIYVIKNNGTITGYYSFDKQEKFKDVTYRILEVRKDAVVLLIREVDLIDVFTGKPNTKPFYQFWTLKPYTLSFLGKKDTMWIETGDFRPWDKPPNPDEKSDTWWLNYYKKDNYYDHYYSKYSHDKLPLGSFKK
jgi:hypothetical protein